MQLPRLELTNTFALLGIEKRDATIEMRQPKADMKISQPQAEVEIHKTKSKLEIDQTEAFADANLKHPLRVMNEWAAKVKQRLLQNLAKEANEGDRLMMIENHQKSIIPQIAKENSEPPQKEINIAYLPKTAENIKFHYTPSEMTIKVKQGDVKIEVKPNSPIIKFNPGDLQIYLKQKESLQIKAVGATLDQKI